MAGFPNVPRLPGVPPLLRAPNFVQIIPTLLSGDVLGAISQLLRRPWGLYNGALPVIFAESVRDVTVRQDTNIPSYVIEGGTLQSYNKVKVPYQGRVRFMMGGTEADRTAMIATTIAACESFDLYDLVMPEAIYPKVNVTHYDFSRRNDQGNGLLTIDIWCEQIRDDAVATFTQTQSPSGESSQSNGTVQTVTVRPASETGASASVPFFGAIT